MRPSIASSIADQVLFRADHTCSICRERGKDIQIHHIDSHNSNNAADNLVVLCLDCHSRVTGDSGLGRRYSIGEVKAYKRDWERLVSLKRGVTRPIIKYKKELISQVDLIICEVLATKRRTRMTELMNVLFELHLYRGSDELDGKIVEGLHHLALQSGLNSAPLAVLVAEILWEMCFHFVGPENVTMSKKERKFVLSCVSALDTLGEFSSGFVRKADATKAFCDNIWNFLDIAIWYNSQEISRQVVAAVLNARKNCWSSGKLEFATGDRLIKSLAIRMIDYVKSDKPVWKPIITRLQYVKRYGG